MKRGIEQVGGDTERASDNSSKKGRTTRSNPMSCNVCNQKIPLGSDELILCTKCDNNFHMQCTGITTPFLIEQFKKVKWICFKCEYATLNLAAELTSRVDKIEAAATNFSTGITKLKHITTSYELLVKNLTVKVEAVENQVKELLDRSVCTCD